MTRDTGDSMTPFEKMVDAIRECRRYGRSSEDCAFAAFSALDAEGWVMVPKEACSVMVAMGAYERAKTEVRRVEQIRRIYTAMLAARPSILPPTENLQRGPVPEKAANDGP